jgi:hypothetical protein
MKRDLDFIDGLLKRVTRMKADILFEEPCPIYEADEEDWDDFWYNEYEEK